MPGLQNPFLDPQAIRTGLYGDSERLAGRSSALLRAKTHGRHPGDIITELIRRHLDPAAVGHLLDLGCGNGTSAVRLARAFPDKSVIASDLSPALLTTAASRARQATTRIAVVCADFHDLPFTTGSA